MYLSEQLRLAGVPTFPCWVRFDQAKNKWAKGPAVPKDESWQAAALRPYNDPMLNWSSGVFGIPIPQGVVIFDIDAYKGANRQAIEAHLGCALNWDAALVQHTISGGQHYAFGVNWPVRQGDSIDGIQGFDTRVAGKGFICSGDGYSQVGFGVMALAFPPGLPPLPDACRARMEAVVTERALTHLPDWSESSADVSQVIAALRHIDPGGSRAQWLRIGYALRHHFNDNDELGLSLWDRWSAGEFWRDGTPTNYVPEHLTAQWPGMKPEGQTASTTIASLFYMAIKGGWTPPATFDVTQAFGSNAVDANVYLGLLERIFESGGDVRQTQEIIEAIRGAGCNTLQVALLAAELKNALKDAGVKDKKVFSLVDAMLAPEGLPRVHQGYTPQVGEILEKDAAMHPTMWAPMHTKGKDLKPKGTQLNFDILLHAYGVQIVFNEIAKDISIRGPSVPGAGVLHQEAALAYLDSLANLNDYPTAAIRSMIMVVANRNTVNPVADWIHGCQWDGQDHVGALFSQIELEPYEDPVFCEMLFRKWMRGAYSIGTGKLKSWEHCVVLVDPYGGAGKTRFFATLCPPELFKKGVILDLSDKDSIKTATSYWIVELGELDGTFSRSDQNKLKAWMSQDFDDIRLPYGRVYMKYPRRTALLGTVNEPHFFLDHSNNRRFWPMEVRSVNHTHTVDVRQAWAQIAYEVAEGRQAHLTPQEDQILFARNEAFRTGSTIADRLSALSITSGDPTDKVITVTGILGLAGLSNPTKSDLNEAARILRKRGLREGRSNGRSGFSVTVLTAPVAGAFKPTVIEGGKQ
jgi:hypothetical protein